MANYPASQPGSKRHTLSVLVENRPGVLARIAGLFARRAFNINSLSVSPTERPDISRHQRRIDRKRQGRSRYLHDLFALGAL